MKFIICPLLARAETELGGTTTIIGESSESNSIKVTLFLIDENDIIVVLLYHNLTPKRLG